MKIVVVCIILISVIFQNVKGLNLTEVVSIIKKKASQEFLVLTDEKVPMVRRFKLSLWYGPEIQGIRNVREGIGSGNQKLPPVRYSWQLPRVISFLKKKSEMLENEIKQNGDVLVDKFVFVINVEDGEEYIYIHDKSNSKETENKKEEMKSEMIVGRNMDTTVIFPFTNTLAGTYSQLAVNDGRPVISLLSTNNE
jgi:hypothetical protein